MARSIYICRGIDQPMPLEQEFISTKLTEWEEEHPGLAVSHHTVQTATTRVNRDGQQRHLREIILTIYYNVVFARA